MCVDRAAHFRPFQLTARVRSLRSVGGYVISIDIHLDMLGGGGGGRDRKV